MIYEIKGGYLILEPIKDDIEEIKIKLTKIAEREALPDNVIKTPEDLQHIGEREGDSDNFLKEK